jgi:NodT family efflux transporter outer membrane factor (OMF) lipoprotein
MHNNRLKLFFASSLAAVLLAGCMVGPKYHQPAATVQPPPAAYKELPAENPPAGQWKVAQPQDALLHGKWWEIYNDPELNALEDQLNINNQNIKLSFENFMEARTLVTQARAQLYPTLSVAPSFKRSQSSATLRNNVGATGTANAPTAGNPNVYSTLTEVPFTASWEPDLWGRVRNTIRQAQYNAQLSAADLEFERLTEQSSLAVFFYELRGQDLLQKILNDTVEADKKSLELARAGYETGVGTELTVVEAQVTLQQAESASTNLGIARAQYEHAIAVLVGTTASGFSIPYKPLNATPPAIPVGIPSQLLERRPDIAASERNMAAANAEIGIYTAAYYPNLTLTALGGFESSTLQSLMTWPSRFWSVGPTVSETIFDAGLRRATVNQYVAVYNADVASYRQTVLTAFQQVEDSLAEVRILSQQIQQQQQAVQSAQQFLDLSLARYETGVDTYLNVLVAQTTLLTDQQQLASLQTLEMTSSVQLIEALGGGWDRSQLPTPAQMNKKATKSEIEAPNKTP